MHNTPDSQPIGSWRDRGACISVDPELFFPVGNLTRGAGAEQLEKAKKVCGRCAVQEVCLQYALETNQNDGVWGGLSEEERRALRRRKRRQQADAIARRALNTRGTVY